MKKTGFNVLLLVLLTVSLGLISVFILKEAVLYDGISYAELFFVMSGALFVNGLRFFIWGYIHKHYPISISYTLNSIFFPMILLMGYFYGEVISLTEVFGVILIAIGVAVMTYTYTLD